MKTLSDLTDRQQALLESRGSSGSALRATSAALALFVLSQQPSSCTAAALEKGAFGTGTIGTGTEVVSLRITQQDLLIQLSRVYQTLSAEQHDLDAEASRILYKNLSSLYV